MVKNDRPKESEDRYRQLENGDVYLDHLVDTADVLPGGMGEADVLNLPPSRYIWKKTLIIL